MALFHNRIRKDLSGTVFARMIFIALIVTTLVGALLYYLTSIYVIRQAEKSIQNLMFSHRGVHHYVQKNMHPALYQSKKQGDISQAFYAPELLSSSFMIRNQHIYYNEALVEAGMPQVYYKMAANNPRNPVNKADALEADLIRMFNRERDKKKFRDIIKIEGRRYLYVAMPFLENKPRCMVCHGDRDAAPAQLQARYPGEGGYNEKLGEIRAVESIRAPLDREFFSVYIITAALICGFLAIMALFLFNQKLGMTVLKRTRELEKENRDRKEAEKEVRQLNLTLEKRVEDRTVQLEAANKELDAFAYSVSHDLRAPLRGIDGFSQALMEDYEDRLDDTANDYLDRVRSGCVRMGRLIDDMLQMSRLTRRKLKRQEVDLSQIAESIFKELKEGYPDRQVDTHSTPGVTVRADAGLMRAVLDNLMGNAWKFTSKTENARIEFGMETREDRSFIFVRDNGAGFDMAYADKLFTAFQRLHSPGEFEGTGIGLATVLRIIHRHGGTIQAEGEVGKGAVFFFSV